ncbi:endonuclease/exonuclease/phosphatase family protein [Lacticaseibacillus jixianensis]|uniref:Endonuclease/exonuclease/phosphatase family protein n=1 Tax=Lacticaseibacillus jixianensis TaxID=2486012 RepID=A0ABW4BAJ6_9LACO|nr:endonuclease/exonuclease/phosphatase family protein [Lacticaseibacillus jixianensis]
MKKHRALKIVGGLLGGVVVALGGYIGYLYAAYYRLPDDLKLTPQHNQAGVVQVGKTYRAQSYNIGYDSYPPSYSFFMDGGKFSRAYSKQAVQDLLAGVIKTTREGAPDFAFFQEVDQDGDRSRHVDEVAGLRQAFDTSSSVYGQNYDSPYLFYPFNQPIGAAKSGLVTLAKTRVTSARRYSLPVATNPTKFTDLDRAFTVTKTPTSNGKHLQLINIHMSAFTKDRAIQAAQFAKLFEYIGRAYQQGDYVIVGGDYNHRLLKDAAAIFHTKPQDETWTHLFPYAQLPKGFHVPTMGLAKAAQPSVRALDQPWRPGQSFVTLIDGFILSPNVQAKTVNIVDTGFKYSDHTPTRLTFALKP